jgi:hypothetical protein
LHPIWAEPRRLEPGSPPKFWGVGTPNAAQGKKPRRRAGLAQNILEGVYIIIDVQASTRADIVKGYMRWGLAPIPLPPRSKNPNRQSWQEERWTLEDVPRLWNNGQNVGILCGSPSGGRVDVDCDCPQAVRLAPKFLQPTLKGGRDTVPGSRL